MPRRPEAPRARHQRAGTGRRWPSCSAGFHASAPPPCRRWPVARRTRAGQRAAAAPDLKKASRRFIYRRASGVFARRERRPRRASAIIITLPQVSGHYCQNGDGHIEDGYILYLHHDNVGRSPAFCHEEPLTRHSARYRHDRIPTRKGFQVLHDAPPCFHQLLRERHIDVAALLSASPPRLLIIARLPRRLDFHSRSSRPRDR